MKKFILICVTSLLCLVGYSQEHFKFMGIPIDGNVTEFCQKLTKKGFTKSETDSYINAKTYEGVFAGYSVYVDVIFTPKSKTVFEVDLTIKDFTEIGEYKSALNSLNEMYKTKYCLEYDNTKELSKMTHTYNLNNFIDENGDFLAFLYSENTSDGNLKGVVVIVLSDYPKYIFDKIIIGYADILNGTLSEEEALSDI